MSNNTTEPDTTFPKSIYDLITRGRNVLGISDQWHIYLKMSEKPGGSDDFAACTNADPTYLNATIEFAPFVETETPKMKYQYVLHELFHVSLSEIDAVVQEILKYLTNK